MNELHRQGAPAELSMPAPGGVVLLSADPRIELREDFLTVRQCVAVRTRLPGPACILPPRSSLFTIESPQWEGWSCGRERQCALWRPRPAAEWQSGSPRLFHNTRLINIGQRFLVIGAHFRWTARHRQVRRWAETRPAADWVPYDRRLGRAASLYALPFEVRPERDIP
jgi:hypothetical protein